MVRECIVCKKLDHINPELSFHKLPNDLEQRKLWLSLVGIEENRHLSKIPVLCSDHFEPWDIGTRTNGAKYIIPGGLPMRMSHSAFATDSSDIASDSTITDSPARKDVKNTGSQNLFDDLITREQIVAKEFPMDSKFDVAGPSHLGVPKEKVDTEPIFTKGCPMKSDFNVASHLGVPLEKEPTSHSSTTLSASETENICQISDVLPTELAYKRRKRRYPGNLVTSDFSTPEKRRKNLQMVKEALHKKRKKIKVLQKSVSRLTKKVKSLKDLLQRLKEKRLISEHSESTITASLSGVPKDVFERLLQGSTRQKYNESLRSFALTLSFYSPRAYSYVRETFNKSLPDLSTISKWFRSINGSPGFTQEALTALQLKKEGSSDELLCSLIYDEMSIRKLVEWTGDKFTGYVDIGTKLNSEILEEAREVLVFLVSSLKGHWKVPVGYFL